MHFSEFDNYSPRVNHFAATLILYKGTGGSDRVALRNDQGHYGSYREYDRAFPLPDCIGLGDGARNSRYRLVMPMLTRAMLLLCRHPIDVIDCDFLECPAGPPSDNYDKDRKYEIIDH